MFPKKHLVVQDYSGWSNGALEVHDVMKLGLYYNDKYVQSHKRCDAHLGVSWHLLHAISVENGTIDSENLEA
jgi:hypothetical protein